MKHDPELNSATIHRLGVSSTLLGVVVGQTEGLLVRFGGGLALTIFIVYVYICHCHLYTTTTIHCFIRIHIY